MGCGCNKRGSNSSNARIAPAASLRSVSTPRTAASPPANITNLNGGSVSKSTETSRKRIEKLQREAIQRAFGK